MGHNIERYSYAIGTSKSAIEAELNERVRKITWQEGGHGLYGPIRFIDEVLPDYEAAVEYINQHDKGWYDQLAVKYKNVPHGKTSKKLQDLKTKLSTAYQEYRTLDSVIAAQSFKADYVGCKHCGSKINRTYIKSNFCPICRTDMRSDTVQKKLSSMKAKIDKLNEDIKAEERSLAAKSNEVCWLVKIEYHT